MPRNVLETEVLSLAGNHSGGQSSEKFLELSFSHTCWFSEYVAWLWKHSVHQHHCASMINCSSCLVAQLSEFCPPWEVRALCLGRSEGRTGIGILSRPSLEESEIWKLISFLRLFFKWLKDSRTHSDINLISIINNLHPKTFNQCQNTLGHILMYQPNFILQ